LKLLFLFFFLLFSIAANAQLQPLSSFPKKGSYAYFRQPAFEDNSFLLDEAFTQPRGVIQNIMNAYVLKGAYAMSLTQQIPVNDKHQVGYTLNYNVTGSGGNQKDNGFGDVYLHYSYALMDKEDPIMLVPEFALIVPTGKGRGYGGWGGQFILAATKRLSPKVITHYNIGYTYIAHADFITSGTSADRTFFEEDLHLQNAAASVVWYPARRFNLMLESTAGLSKKVIETRTEKVFNLTVNPGVRFLIDHGRGQIVPGVSVPINLEGSRFAGAGLFFYLSYEPDYLAFFKPKGS
jgi:hypothetical protein